MKTRARVRIKMQETAERACGMSVGGCRARKVKRMKQNDVRDERRPAI